MIQNFCFPSPCSASTRASFSSATYLIPATFLSTYLFAKFLIHLYRIQPPSTASFSLFLSLLPGKILILISPLYICIRQFSPPYYWGARKRPQRAEQFSFPFSLPAAGPSTAHSSSRSCGRCFPTHCILRCSARMEHVCEGVVRAGMWLEPVKSISQNHRMAWSIELKRTSEIMQFQAPFIRRSEL